MVVRGGTNSILIAIVLESSYRTLRMSQLKSLLTSGTVQLMLLI